MNLIAENEITLYVVYSKITGNVVLETENEIIAKGLIFNDSGLEYSTYPAFCYAPNKTDRDFWVGSHLEY